MGDGLIPSDVKVRVESGHRLVYDIVGLYPGHAQGGEEGSPTVWYSLAPPGPSVRSPETDKQSKQPMRSSLSESEAGDSGQAAELDLGK